MNKNEIRQYIRNEKRQHSQRELGALSLLACSKLNEHPRITAAKTVLLYCPLPDEVDVRPLLDMLVQQGKQVILPKVVSESDLTLHPYKSNDDLEPGAFGIMEPTSTELSQGDIEDTAVAIIPGMAFDTKGHRLGRGKGYYDRLLSRLPHIYKIGICFYFQLMESIPTDRHDIVMDEIIYDNTKSH